MSIFTPSRRNRAILNISFMNEIYILYDDRDKTVTKPPYAELRVVGKTFWTPTYRAILVFYEATIISMVR
jgi:hypothetical protein